MRFGSVVQVSRQPTRRNARPVYCGRGGLTASENELKAIVADAANTLGKSAPNGALLDAVSSHSVDHALALFATDSVAAQLQADAGRLFHDEFRNAMTNVAGRIGADEPHDLTALARAYADRKALALANDITDRTAARDILVDVLGRGVATDVAAKLLRGVLGLDARSANALAKYTVGLASRKLRTTQVTKLSAEYADRLTNVRADRVARTELVAAQNNGRQEMWLQAQARGTLGQNPIVMWVTAEDDEMCPECEDLDGEEITLGDSFSSGDEQPPAHPGCRCTTVIVDLDDGSGRIEVPEEDAPVNDDPPEVFGDTGPPEVPEEPEEPEE